MPFMCCPHIPRCGTIHHSVEATPLKKMDFLAPQKSSLSTAPQLRVLANGPFTLYASMLTRVIFNNEFYWKRSLKNNNVISLIPFSTCI